MKNLLIKLLKKLTNNEITLDINTKVLTPDGSKINLFIKE